jgi:nascent polypeptide-associated complex subunit alpha
LASRMAMPGMDPRAMAAAMKRMGVEMRDIPGVEEVVVKTAREEYRFKRAQVSVMKAQGQETWTVVGKPEVVPRGGAPAGNIPTNVPDLEVPEDAAAVPYKPTAEDVKTVMDAAHVPEAAARKALVETDGDLAEAILKLS